MSTPHPRLVNIIYHYLLFPNRALTKTIDVFYNTVAPPSTDTSKCQTYFQKQGTILLLIYGKTT